MHRLPGVTSVRIARESFWHLHALIKEDPVFKSTGCKPQRPLAHQLAAFLVQMGAETGIKSATSIGIAEGTVFLYCKRVTRAIRNICDHHLAWPGPARRQFLSSEMGVHGFPGCISIGDGTYIRLAGKPQMKERPFAYYCRKKFYAVNMINNYLFIR